MEAIELRRLLDMSDLLRCTEIEKAIWGEGIVPVHMLRAVTQMGGLAIGAFSGSEMAGFVFGFLGSLERDGQRRLLHHSHVMGVLPRFRGRGIGAALKRFQAQCCLEQGVELMTWTFDPLRGRNAHLNIENLGAIVRIYEPKHYGDMHDAQNGQLDSDRLLAEWHLAEPAARWDGDPDSLLPALQTAADGGPAEPLLDLSAQAVHVAVPADLDELLTSSPAVAVRWRLAVRDTLMHYLNSGFTASRFLRGGYVLHRD